MGAKKQHSSLHSVQQTAESTLLIGPLNNVYLSVYPSEHFYRAMHFSAERGLAIACRLSVCDYDVGDL